MIGCYDCKQLTSGDCGKHGTHHVVGVTLYQAAAIMAANKEEAERQYARAEMLQKEVERLQMEQMSDLSPAWLRGFKAGAQILTTALEDRFAFELAKDVDYHYANKIAKKAFHRAVEALIAEKTGSGTE